MSTAAAPASSPSATPGGPAGPRPPSRLRRHGRALLIAVVALLLAWLLLGAVVAPRWLQHELPKQAAERLGAELAIGDLRINPFTLVAHADDLTLGTPRQQGDASSRIHVQRVRADLAWRSLLAGGAVVEALDVEGADVHLVRSRDGTLDLPWRLPERPSAASADPRFTVGRLAVRDSRVRFEDRSLREPFTLALESVTAEVTGLVSPTTAAGSGTGAAPDASTPDPAGADGVAGRPPAPAAADADAVTGGPSSAQDRRPPPRWRVSARGPGDARVAGEGTLHLQPLRVDGSAKVERVRLTTLWPELAPQLAAVLPALLQRPGAPLPAPGGTLTLGTRLSVAPGAVRLEELAGSIDDLRVPQETEQPAHTEIEQVTLAGGRVDTDARQVTLGRVHVGGGRLLVERDAKGRLQVFGMTGAQAGAAARAKAARPVTDATPAWRIALDELAVGPLKLVARDRTYTPAVGYAIDVQEATLRDYVHGPAEDRAAAGGPARLRVVAEVRPGEEASRPTKGDAVAAARDPAQAAPPEVTQPATPGRLQVDLALTGAPAAAHGTLDFDGIALRPLRAVLAHYVDLDLRAGLAAGRLQLAAGDGPATLGGMLRLDEVRLNEAEIAEPLLAWRRLTARGVALKLAPASLRVREVVVERPRTRVQIDENRKVNLARVVASNMAAGGRARAARTVAKGEAPAAGSADAPPPTPGDRAAGGEEPRASRRGAGPAPGREAGGEADGEAGREPGGEPAGEPGGASGARPEVGRKPGAAPDAVPDRGAAVAAHQQADGTPDDRAPRTPVVIDRLVLRHGVVDYSDASLVLPFATRVVGLAGTVVGISNDPAQRARVQARGSIPPFGSARIDGAIAMADAKRFTDLEVAFENVQMPALSPYTATFAGRTVSKGRLWLDLDYRIEQSRLLGSNRVVLRDFALGDRVSKGRRDLPLDLAVALLRLPDGTIDVTVPVRGTLSDPRFSVVEAAANAFAGLLQRIVTAPFRVLAGLLPGGGTAAGVDDGLARVDFRPGRAGFAPAERERLTRLAAALQLRPALKVTVPAPFDPARDTAAIRDAALRRQVMERLGRTIVQGEPDPIVYEDAATQAVLEALLRERGGADAPQRLLHDWRQARARAGTAQSPGARGGRSGGATSGGDTAAARDRAEFFRAVADRLMAAHPVPDAELEALGEERARRTADLLATLGVPASQIEVAAPAPTDPGLGTPSQALDAERVVARFALAPSDAGDGAGEGAG